VKTARRDERTTSSNRGRKSFEKRARKCETGENPNESPKKKRALKVIKKKEKGNSFRVSLKNVSAKKREGL